MRWRAGRRLPPAPRAVLREPDGAPAPAAKRRRSWRAIATLGRRARSTPARPHAERAGRTPPPCLARAERAADAGYAATAGGNRTERAAAGAHRVRHAR